MQKKIYFLGALALLITAIFSKGYHHFDEHFQILEFASLKLGIAHEKDMPWEYFFKMRPALQPAMVVCFYRITDFITTPDPFLISTFLRILSAVLSFLTTLLFIRTFQTQIQSQKLKQIFLCLSFFLWFVIYNQVRFSSENWAGNIFLIALCLSFRDNKKFLHFLLIGLLLGLSFLFRYQTGFLIIGLATWLLFIRKEKIFHVVSMSFAVFVMIGAGILIDKWFYGEWTFTVWNYFDQNILQNKAAGFGVEPWWYYLLQVIINAIPPFSIFYLLAFFLFCWLYPKHIITFSVLPFLLVHFFIGHKEMRFLFPLLAYLPFTMTMAMDYLSKYRFSKEWLVSFKIFALAFGLTNIILVMIVMFKPADSLIPLYEKLYDDYNAPTVLYYTDANPYVRILNISFYKRTDLELAQVSYIADIKQQSDRKILFSSEHPEQLNGNENNWRLVYSSLPEWVKKFNFNHWQERTRFWYVYELKP